MLRIGAMASSGDVGSKSGGDDLLGSEIFRQAVAEHAEFLGMDSASDSRFFWLAEEALLAELPPEWEHFTDDNGNPYYYNTATGESSWENPLDQPYRELFQRLKREGESEPGSAKVSAARQHLLKKFNAAAAANEKKVSPMASKASPPGPPKATKLPPKEQRRNPADLAKELGLDEGEFTEESSDEEDESEQLKKDDLVSASLSLAEKRIEEAEKKGKRLEEQLEAALERSAKFESEAKSERKRADEAEKESEELVEKMRNLAKQKSQSAGASVAARLGAQRKIDDLSEEVKKASVQLQAAEEEKSRVYEALKEARRAILESQEEMGKLRGQTIEARESEAAQQRKASRALNEVKLLEDAVARLKTELKDGVDTNLKLREELLSAQSRLTSAERAANQAKLSAPKEECKADTEALKMELEASKSEVAALHEELDRVRCAKIESVASPDVRARESRDNLFTRLNEVTKELNAAEAETSRLVHENSVLRGSVKKLQDESAASNEEASTRATRLIETTEKLEASERAVQRLSGECTMLKNALENVKRELDDEINASHALRAKQRETQDKLSSLERQIARNDLAAGQVADASRRQMQGDLDALAAKCDAIDKENASLRDELAAAHSSRSKRESDEVTRRLEAVKQAEHMSVELDSAKAAHSRSLRQIEALEGTLNDLRLKAREKDEELGKLSRELITAREKFESGERRADRVSSERALFESSLESLKAELEKERSLNDEIKLREAERAEHAKNAESRAKRAAARVSDLEAQLSMRESAASEAGDLREQVDKLLRELDDAKHASSKQLALVKRKAQEDLAHKVREAEESAQAASAASQASEEIDSLKSQLRILKQTSGAQVENLEKELMEVIVRLREETKLRRELHNRLIDLQGNIRVYCRVRPVLDNEKRQGSAAASVAVSFPESDKIALRQEILARDQEDKFEFDRVFQPHSTQASVFADVEPLAMCAMDGYRVCIFAYGQTGSGKTYTMDGIKGDPGVNTRALQGLFQIAEEKKSVVDYKLRLSMLEIYNETIQDLLVSRSQLRTSMEQGTHAKLEIRQGPGGLYVPGLTWVDVASMDDVRRFMEHGSLNRTTASHNVNERSSRSHLVVTVEVSGDIENGKRIQGKLNLIDLAGSERLGKTAARGHQLEEAKNINRSLSALGNVIDALGKKKKGHVPFRNSKLTYLLQDSLNGTAKVLMFVNLSPVAWNASETLCSLKFAKRCRATALGEAKKNIESDVVAEKSREIEILKEKLAAQSGGGDRARFGYRR